MTSPFFPSIRPLMTSSPTTRRRSLNDLDRLDSDDSSSVIANEQSIRREATQLTHQLEGLRVDPSSNERDTPSPILSMPAVNNTAVSICDYETAAEDELIRRLKALIDVFVISRLEHKQHYHQHEPEQRAYNAVFQWLVNRDDPESYNVVIAITQPPQPISI